MPRQSCMSVGARTLLPAPGMRQAHTGGDKHRRLGQSARLGISFSGCSPGPETGSEHEDAAQVRRICCGVFLVPRNAAGREGRKTPGTANKKPWASVAQDPRAATLQPGAPSGLYQQKNVGLSFRQRCPPAHRPLQTLGKTAVVPGSTQGRQEVARHPPPALAPGTAPEPVDALAAIKGSPTSGLSFATPHRGPHLRD